MKYQRINSIVDAIQWLPSRMQRPQPFEPDELGVLWYFSPNGEVSLGLIETAVEDFQHVNPGDWIVTDSAGDVGVETPKDFAAKYKLVEAL